MKEGKRFFLKIYVGKEDWEPEHGPAGRTVFFDSQDEAVRVFDDMHKGYKILKILQELKEEIL